MTAVWFCCAGLAAGAPMPSGGGPTVAVLPIQARAGMTQDAGELFTSQMVTLVRNGGAFKKVLSTKDLEAVLGLEQQKQLLDCSTTGCAAEIAGGLAVSHVLTGTLGQLGESLLLDLKLIRVEGQVTAVSVSRRVRGGAGGADALLDALPGAVEELLARAGLAAPGAGPSPAHWSSWVLWPGLAAGGAAALGLVASIVVWTVDAAFVGGVYGLVPLPVARVPFGARLGVAAGLALGGAGLVAVSALLVLAAAGMVATWAWGRSQP